MIKKILSALLCAPLLLCGVTAVAVQGVSATLYNIYGNGMLFEQNKDAVFAGTADAGAAITVSLYNSANELTASGSCVAEKDGTFSVSFKAPAGGYEEYTVILCEDGAQFAKLEKIVFGELWLASGQSNMMYPLGQDRTMAPMFREGKKLSKWLRVLIEPAYPEYKGSAEKIPFEAQNEIKDAKWVSGEDYAVYSMSAVAYHFAANLMQELDMPVGILNSSLGGSNIESWISREAIDGCDEVKNLLSSKGRYINEADWNEDGNIYGDMTANFNLRTNAYRHFRPSGIIWYQGESDLMLGYLPEEYAIMFDLLQKSYTEHFSFDGGLMPIVYTHIAPYFYSDTGLNMLDWNISYTAMQTEEPETRAVISNYDVPVTYVPEAGLIHPEHKEEIGARMAFAAMGMVYGKGGVYSAASAESFEIKGSEVYVKIKNTGDSLMQNGAELCGFTLCEANGIFVAADAEIVAPDTVKVFADGVTAPVGVAYAYCVNNYRSNLFSSAAGKLLMPVTPFVFGAPENAVYWTDLQWTDCSESEHWHNRSDTDAAYFPSWGADGAELFFTAEKNLNLKSESKEFTVSPVTTYTDGYQKEAFRDIRTDYSSYGTLSFYIRNNGSAPVSIDGVDYYSGSIIKYTAFADESVIPADSEWHKVTLDLNSLALLGKEGLLSFSNNSLDNVKEIKLRFSCDESSDITLDRFRFAAEAQNTSIKLNPDFSVTSALTAFLMSIVSAVTGLFC